VTAALELKLGEVVAELHEVKKERDELGKRLAAALLEIEQLKRTRADSAHLDPNDDDDIELVEEPERVAILPEQPSGDNREQPPSLPSPSLDFLVVPVTGGATVAAPVAPVVSVVPSAPTEAPKISVAPTGSPDASLSRVVVSTFPPASEERVSRPSNPGGRRRAERRDCEFEVEFLGDTHFTTGITQDLSEGGVFVATYQRLPIGTSVFLAFDLPGQHRVEVRGEVRWIRSEQPDAGTRPGLGIAFTEMSSAALASIVEFCGTVPARYYEI
jgi:uncharacterized protein (TIGR02266 family)